MAQKLKEEVKDRIIDSALDLMLEVGFNNADMRSIAKKANITHGNLYRYFKNKEDLITYITQPLIDSMNEILTKQTGGTLKVFDDDIQNFIEAEAQKNPDEIYERISTLAFENVRAFFVKGKEHPKAMKIVLQDNIMKENITNWTKNIAAKGFYEIYDINNISNDNLFVFDVILNAFACGFCESISSILKSCLELSPNEFDLIVKNYIDIQLKCLKYAAAEQIKIGTFKLKSEG